LPTEICLEPYRSVDKDEMRTIRRAHDQAYELLKGASRVILWGVSLNIYDAELGVLLAESAQDTDGKEYFVVNPCRLPARRVHFLTGKKPRHIIPAGTRCAKDCCRERADAR